jgi:5,10-methylenetetrahydromethanopterin reductase
MVKLGICLIAYRGALKDLIKCAKSAEEIGLDFIMCADDFSFRDIFPILSIIAMETSRIGLSFITNPYTRHPAIIASTVATLDEISNGRMELGLCPGGSLTLKPLCIPMWNKPISAIKESVEICKRLIKGEIVNYDGKMFKLKEAQLLFTPIRKNVPIFIVGRGPRLLQTAGMLADGIFYGLMPLGSLDFVIEQIKKGAYKAGRKLEEIKIYGAIEFTTMPKEEFEEFLKLRVANVIMDTPNSILETLQLDKRTMKIIRNIKQCKSVLEAIKLITNDVAKVYPVVNTIDACIEIAKELIKKGINEIAIIVPSGKETQIYPILKDEIIPMLKVL